MARLVLVKHADPQQDPRANAQRWVLSDAGRASCAWLADQFRSLGVARIYASLEPKALETAALAAARLGQAVRPREGLQENDRTGVGYVSAEAHRRRFHEFFDAPDKLSMGQETADQAHQRFLAAVRAAQAESAGEDIAVVAHGTVITLLVSRANGIAPFALWDRLGLPSCLVLDGESLAWDGEVLAAG